MNGALVLGRCVGIVGGASLTVPRAGGLASQKLSLGGETHPYPSLFLAPSLPERKATRAARFCNARVLRPRAGLDGALEGNPSQIPDLMSAKVSRKLFCSIMLLSCISIKDVKVDLSNKSVRILSNLPIKQLEGALDSTGLNSRLIGQGTPDEMELTAAVAEFKGPEVFGVIRFAHVNMNTVRVESDFSGLGSAQHTLSIHQFGDITRGPHSTGDVYNKSHSPDAPTNATPGILGDLAGDESGRGGSTVTSEHLRVWDLIGRAVVLYDANNQRIAAAVIARSAGVGENYKNLCLCDGTVIWQSTNSDFVKQAVA